MNTKLNKAITVGLVGVALAAGSASAMAAHVSVGIGVPIGPAYPAYGYTCAYGDPYCPSYGYAEPSIGFGYYGGWGRDGGGHGGGHVHGGGHGGGGHSGGGHGGGGRGHH
jgi:hypothetical protein